MASVPNFKEIIAQEIQKLGPHDRMDNLWRYWNTPNGPVQVNLAETEIWFRFDRDDGPVYLSEYTIVYNRGNCRIKEPPKRLKFKPEMISDPATREFGWAILEDYQREKASKSLTRAQQNRAKKIFESIKQSVEYLMDHGISEQDIREKIDESIKLHYIGQVHGL